MDTLSEALLLEILSRLDDSADVARCRVASKAFNSVYPLLRSINLQCTYKWSSKPRPSQPTSFLNHISKFFIKSKPKLPNYSTSSSSSFKTVFVHLISNLKVVESVCISNCLAMEYTRLDLYLTDDAFVNGWLPRVSETLRFLSITDLRYRSHLRPSNLLHLLSASCHNLVELKVEYAWLSVENLNLMPMLTRLTLVCITLEDEQLNVLIKCFPNLQALNLIGIPGLQNPEIRLLNLKFCFFERNISRRPLVSLRLITPNLVTFRLECFRFGNLFIEAPMLAHFQLHLYIGDFTMFPVKKFDNLKTLWLKSTVFDSLLNEFQLTETLENLTVDSPNSEIGAVCFNLEKVCTLFPNLTSLCIKSSGWSELVACNNPLRSESWVGSRLKTFRAYLLLVDLSVTFSSVAYVLNKFCGLSDVSLLIHHNVAEDVSKRFISKCMTQWPKLKWRWGIWRLGTEDPWVTDSTNISH